MRPRADEVLTNVVETFDEYVLPDVTDQYARSMATVMSGLLRQVILRIEHEGQALYDDVHEARVALQSVLDFLESGPARGAISGAEGLATEIRLLVGKVYRPAREYPSLISLAEEALELTAVLDRADRTLIDAKAELADDERYAAVREEIRRFAAAQLQREATWGFGTLINPGL